MPRPRRRGKGTKKRRQRQPMTLIELQRKQREIAEERHAKAVADFTEGRDATGQESGA